MTDSEHVPNTPKTYTRRQILGLGGALAATGIVATEAPALMGVLKKLSQHLPDATPLPAQPEVLRDHPTEFGFATHVFVKPENGNAMTIDMFKQNVDLLAANGQQWIRFNIWDWEATNSTDSELSWNEQNLEHYDEAIQYARSKGLNINLVANTPTSLKNVPHDQYLQFTQDYFATLADRYKGQVAVWQLFNEIDTRDFRTYDLITGLSDKTRTQLQAVIKTASEAVKTADPAAKTSINMTASRTDQQVMDYETLDALAPYVDILGFDYYPGAHEEIIAALPHEIDALHARYPNNELAIPEIGISTSEQSNISPENQGIFLGKALDALQTARYNPRLVFINTLTDEPWLNDGNNWGLLTVDRKPKASFDSVISRMQPPK